jgi:hypothetical protein
MNVDAETLAVLRELETKLHQRAVRNSPKAVSGLLTDDFIEFGKSGRIYDKSAILELLKNDDTDEPIEVRDFAARRLALFVVLLTDRTATALRSSVWIKSNGSWRMSFHQGTPI